jgi:hypothetical protein
MRGTRVLTGVVLLASAVAVALVPGPVGADDSDCFVLGTDVVVRAGETKDCDVLVVQGDVIVEEGGTVDGDVAVAGGSAEVRGRVNGDLWASGDITLGASARVEGDAVALGEVVRAPGATVGGRSGRVQNMDAGLAGAPASDGGLSNAARAGVAAAGVLGAVVVAGLFAALAVAVAPDSMGRVRDALRASPGRSFAVGLVALVVAPLLLVIMFFVAPVLLLVYVLFLAVGAVGVSEWFGAVLAGGQGRAARAGIGGAVLALLLGIGYFTGSQIDRGWPISLLTLLLQVGLSSLALGAAMLTLIGKRPWPRGVAAESDAGELLSKGES